MPNNAFTRHLSAPIPQSEQADPRQVPNSASGHTFTVDAVARLERFLILGTDSGTYYVNEKDLTKQNINFLIDLIKSDDFLVWDTIKDISENGRAYRNSPAIFALVLMFRHGVTKDTPQQNFEKTAKTLFPYVVRTSTHLFEFCKYVELTGGWSRSLRSAVSGWYTSKDSDKLAYQAVKYRQRDGWTHRDVVRLSHPTGVNQEVGNFILGKELGEIQNRTIYGFEQVQEATTKELVLGVLDEFNFLPWETIPTQFLKEPEVWKKLFYNGQLNGQALVRNITRLARIEAFNDMMFARDYANRLIDEDMIRKTRLHPINYLNAVVVHTQGQINRNVLNIGNSMYRTKEWQSSPIIVDALNTGFHLAFKHVESANKRTFIGVDVSSSMQVSACFGIDLSAAQVSGAMAMTIAKTEPMHMIYGFTSGGGYIGGRARLTDLGITANMGLPEAMSAVQKSNFGSTDCALPMLFATRNKIEADTFVIITDNETWIGNVHPHNALKEYRQKMGIDARLAVLGVSSTGFTIADPTDRGSMDFVGFDANAPKVLADFSGARI